MPPLETLLAVATALFACFSPSFAAGRMKRSGPRAARWLAGSLLVGLGVKLAAARA